MYDLNNAENFFFEETSSIAIVFDEKGISALVSYLEVYKMLRLGRFLLRTHPLHLTTRVHKRAVSSDWSCCSCICYMSTKRLRNLMRTGDLILSYFCSRERLLENKRCQYCQISGNSVKHILFRCFCLFTLSSAILTNTHGQ